MRLYLDENVSDPYLVPLLRRAGHAAVLPAQVGMAGDSDPKQLTYAIQQGLVLLTRNHEDFVELHELVLACGGVHPGILTIRSDNDPKRDMKNPAVIAAIRRLEWSGAPIANHLHVLNQWR